MPVRLTGQSPELRPLLKLIGVDPDTVTGLMIHLETPIGTIVVHTLCCDHAYRALLTGLIAEQPVEVELDGE